jgi:hypothetical protein
MTNRRADLLSAIAELCQRCPGWRLGQLIANVSGWADEDVWNVSDEQLLEAVRMHLGQLSEEEHRATA